MQCEACGEEEAGSPLTRWTDKETECTQYGEGKLIKLRGLLHPNFSKLNCITCLHFPPGHSDQAITDSVIFNSHLCYHTPCLPLSSTVSATEKLLLELESCAMMPPGCEGGGRKGMRSASPGRPWGQGELPHSRQAACQTCPPHGPLGG